jgi:hypothetical protein
MEREEFRIFHLQFVDNILMNDDRREILNHVSFTLFFFSCCLVLDDRREIFKKKLVVEEKFYLNYILNIWN